MKHSITARKIAHTSMCAALIFLATMLHLPVGSHGGYIHFGDSLVYLAACILPLPYAMIAAAVGAGLSDILSPGGVVWLLPTVLIKPLCCLAFSRKTNRTPLLCIRNLAALLVGAGITTVGYYLASTVIVGSPIVALADIPGYLVQSAGSAICFLLWATALDRSGLRRRLSL